MKGKSSKKFNGLREKLLKILSFVEAKIDFPDEDLPKNIINEIQKTSNNVLKEIKKTLNDQKVGERIREGFKIAIVGPALNALEKIGLIILKEDKDVDQISNSLKGLFDELIISTVPNAQLMSIDELNKSLNRCNIICKPIAPIEKAFNYILDKAEKGAVTIIFGSHYAARSIYKFFEINFDNVTI